MTIKFQYVEGKNVMSYGMTKTRIDLDRSPSTLIVGDNGSGKSSIYELIHICLFGSSIRGTKKARLVNNKNKKGAEMAVGLIAGGDSYRIERGIKPDYLHVIKNGEALNAEASVTATQAIINRDILKTDKIGFQITTLVSKSGYDMFMGLKSDERKKFVDHMLDTAVFTDMVKLNNANLSGATATLDALKNDVSRSTATLEGKEELRAQRLEDAKTSYLGAIERFDREREAIDWDITETKQKIENHAEPDVSGLLGELKAAQKALRGIQSRFIEDVDTSPLDERKNALKADLEAYGDGRLAELVEMRQELAQKLSKNQAKIEMLGDSLEKTEGGFCVTCGQQVDAEHKEEERKRLTVEIQSLTKKNQSFEEFRVEIDQEVKEIRALVDDLSSVEKEIESARKVMYESQRELTGRIADAQHKVSMLNADIKLADVTHAKTGEALLSGLESLIKKRATMVEPVAPDYEGLTRQVDSDIALIKASVKDKNVEIESCSENVLQLKVIADILKGGAKLAIVNTFIPIINRIANEKLLELGFNARFELQPDFSDAIYYNGMEPVEFAQLSEGEKLRINIAMLLTWREIAKMQGKLDSNLLMFDEKLDGSLDHDGYEALADIFERLGGLNIFVISHNAPKMENFIRSKITVEREDGYSTIK